MILDPGSGIATPIGTYNPKYRVKLNQSVQKMFPNYNPSSQKKSKSKSSILCSCSVRSFVTISALSLHSIFEGLAVGLEPTSEDVWQLFGGKLHNT